MIIETVIKVRLARKINIILRDILLPIIASIMSSMVVIDIRIFMMMVATKKEEQMKASITSYID